MGKSPAKWLKSILLGRKPSNYKSNLSKRREPSCNVQINANKEEVVPASGLIMEPALIPLPAGGLSSTTNIVQLSLGKGECLDAADDEDHFQLVKHDGDSTTTTLGSPGDPDRKILEQAVTKTQAMYRGYLARRAFRALKGIIRLQALIRGHLVRRQAVATLFCTIAVVKVQRAVRGQKLQYSDFGIVVHGRSNLKKHLNSQHLHSFRISASCRSKNLSTNGVIHKLLAPSPIMMPLCLQYDQREPNSAFVWLERWTKSCFWKGNMQTNDIVDMKSHTRVDSSQALETEDSQSKHFVHKSPLTVENGSVISVAESKKSKADLSKASRLAVPVHEPQPNEIEKVKRNLRKTSSSSIKTSDHKEADAEKLMHALKKSSSSASPDVPPLVVADSTEKKIGVTALVPPPVDTESCSKLISDAVIEQVDGLKDDTGLELKAKETDARIDDMVAMDYEQETKDEPSNFVNQITENKASLATKRDSLENRSRDSPRIPSYMASTKSAKAKFRGQSSPKLASDEIEKSSATRRYSLPASIHRKSNSVTPQVQKVAQNGKRGSRSEKSVSSSKEAGDKVSLPEWKR